MKLLHLRKLFLGLLLLLLAGSMYAQTTTVTGKVADTQGAPLIGVNVVVKGTTTGTITDIDGNYSIKVSDPQAVLSVSFVGYKTQDFPVGSQTQINVALEEDVTKLEELVVIGYGSQKKSDVTGAVAVVNTENLQKIASSNIAKTLQGQTSGVQVFGGGEPGAQQKVQIRGIGTFGNSEPLYVLDGVPISGAVGMGGAGALNFENNTAGFGSSAPAGGISDFNPTDIESVQVLKDASSAAIYGARGANGVIIITTKKGKAGTMKINYDGSYGVQSVVERMKMANRVQFQEVNNDARLNNDQFLAEANDSTSVNFVDSIDTDWQDATFKQGFTTNHNLSLQGGTENSNYYANIGYFDQTGTVVGNGPRYTKYSTQLKLEQKKGRLKIVESVSFTKTNQIRLTNQRWNNFITDLLMSIPTVPIYDTANIGGFGGSNQYFGQTAGNPIAFNSLPEVTFDRSRFLGVLKAELEIFKFLTYGLNLSYDRSDWHNKEFLPIYFVGDKFTNSVAKLTEWRGENPKYNIEHLINFKQIIGKHDIAAVAGFAKEKEFTEELQGHKEGYTEPYLKYISGSISNPSTLGVRYEHSLMSYLGRLNYAFDEKYLLTATLRRDYSSNFGPKNKYGTFPSFSLGWKLSKEEFFKNNLPQINMMKLRGGYGVIGNEAIPAYLYETSMNSAATYYFGKTLNSGVTQTRYRDPSIKWEERKTTDIGLDMALLNNKVEITAEYYKNECNNILMALPLPISSGIGGWSIDAANAASMVNKGIEFSAAYREFEGDLHYSVSANITTLNNEVTKIGESNVPIQNITTASMTAVGHSMGEIYAYQTEGIIQNESEINKVAPGTDGFDPNKHAFQDARTTEGDVKFVDKDGNGIINAEDMTYLGSVIPKFNYGINLSAEYKGFDLSVFVQGIYGNKVFNQLYRQVSSLGKQESNYTLESYENYWKPTRRSNVWPRAGVIDYNDNNRISDRWVQDGSYWRIQNIMLGYTIPKSILEAIKGLESVRVYVQGQNLFTQTNLWGYDPDFINDGALNRGFNSGSYPSPRTFLVGVKIGL